MPCRGARATRRHRRPRTRLPFAARFFPLAYPQEMSGSVTRTPQQRLILAIAITASFVAFLDSSVVNVALPSIVKQLGGGLTTQQWTVDAYLLTLGSLILVAGSGSDAFGRQRVLRIGLILFGIASLAIAVAPTAGLLIAARLLQGV